jgi:hypothetical protein
VRWLLVVLRCSAVHPLTPASLSQAPLVTTYESLLCDSLLAGQGVGDWNVEAAEHMREVLRLRLGEALLDNVDIMVRRRRGWWGGGERGRGE